MSEHTRNNCIHCQAAIDRINKLKNEDLMQLAFEAGFNNLPLNSEKPPSANFPELQTYGLLLLCKILDIKVSR